METLEQIVKTIRSNPNLEFLLRDLNWLYDQYCVDKIPQLTYSMYFDFNTTGNRKHYETQYFAKRARLNTLAMKVMLEGETYVRELENILWSICDEATWCVPAHMDYSRPFDFNRIDLFAAETGFALSEICTLLQDKLDKLVVNRVGHELQERIIQSYLNTHFAWEQWTTNWSAVCAGSVAITFMYAAPQRYQEIATRIEQTMECFLSGYGEEGVCEEGYMYWKYGFGFFVYFADHLYRFTQGKKDWFALEKVAKIAEYQQNIFLTKTSVASFSDSSPEAAHYIGLTSYLHNRYKERVVMLPLDVAANYAQRHNGDNCFRWGTFFRNFLWYSTDTINPTQNRLSAFTYYDSCQWFFKRAKRFSFAAKGGHNNEPHNHNDVGSFILCDDSEQALCDLGAGEYTKEYFGKERYQIFCNSSLSHNVPIINGTGQCAGAQHKATVLTVTETQFKIELAQVYVVEGMQHFTRQFDVADDFIQLTDTFVGEQLHVTERFITRQKPLSDGNAIILSYFRITVENADYNLRSNKYVNHSSAEEEVYCLDFQVRDVSIPFRMKITLSASPPSMNRDIT